MRFYAMGNYYLSSIQQGIQAAHALGEMVAKYQVSSNGAAKVCYEWLQHHKTMVLLNGGNSHDLKALWALLSDPRNTEFPVSKFYEDAQSLNGALTCVAIVLPDRLYEAKWDDVSQPIPAWYQPDGEAVVGWEAELLDVIKKLPLAR